MAERGSAVGRNAWGTATLFAVMLVPLASAGLAVAAPAPYVSHAADPGACADVLFLGARGSGQPQSGSSSDGGSGLGPQVQGVAQRLASRLPGRAITSLAVTYPAQGVELLAIDPTAYFAGLEQGVASVRSTLIGRAARCPDERIVLSGYSQGAMVMHRAIQDIGSSPDSGERSILARLDGAVLISDGDRRRRDRETVLGTAAHGQGIGYARRTESGARGTKLPAGMKRRIQSVCLRLDVICDYRPAFHNGPGGVQGAQIHSTGYDDSAFVRRATDAVAARIR
jgi:hypothetical protein